MYAYPNAMNTRPCRYLFREYLLHDFSKISSNDSRVSMIVKNPDEANVFLIDHDWIRYNMKDCGASITKHIAGIVHNVVDLHPYYNRSGGKDHFMMAAYDKGAFCDMQCSHDNDASILLRIQGASFIGK